MKTDELITITVGILDRLMLLRDITSRPDCNTCKQGLHEKCPKLGQSVVYGCPLHEKKDCLDNLIVDYTYEEKQEQIKDEKMIDAIGFAIKATDSQDDYSMGMRNGMRYVKSLIDGKEPQFEFRRTDEEIKLGIDLGDEVIGDYGAKGVVVGMDTDKGKILLSLLMSNHKVPQLVKASGYKKTGRHFPQIIEVLEQMKGDTTEKIINLKQGS